MTVFADTLYWVAICNPHDPWHHAALHALQDFVDPQIVTSEEVLTEFLTALSSGGAHLRKKAIAVVRSILDDPSVVVLPQTHITFIDGMALYENRLDKHYSLVDCISMNSMKDLNITHVLSNDHHFTQEGFTTLIHR
jgi:predicted nucleic acid-binding protein